MSRQLTPERQLEGWLAGRPSCPNTRGECCPDFSCCKPELMADEETRRRFVDAEDLDRHSMLAGFLGAAVALASEKRVHIAGDPAERSEPS